MFFKKHFEMKFWDISFQSHCQKYKKCCIQIEYYVLWDIWIIYICWTFEICLFSISECHNMWVKFGQSYMKSSTIRKYDNFLLIFSILFKEIFFSDKFKKIKKYDQVTSGKFQDASVLTSRLFNWIFPYKICVGVPNLKFSA